MTGAAAHETDYAADPLWRLVAQQLPPGYARYAMTDPDGVLADAVVAEGLAARGLRLVTEADPIALRAALLAAEPATPERPLALTTPHPLATLPYDFWQQARPVDLALHRLFPNLDYVTLQRLTPAERRRLAAALATTPVPAPLGARHTQNYLLTHVFADSPSLPAWLGGAGHPDAAAAVRSLRQAPAWALAALAEDEQARHAQQITDTLAAIEHTLASPAATSPGQPALRWPEWQAIARHWAQITGRRYTAAHALPGTVKEHLTAVEARLDAEFAAWVRRSYATLGGQRLPEPHHLFHVPGYLQTRRSRYPRIALVVLDGMSLAAWQRIRAVWAARHNAWRIEERLILSQVPSVTAIARQALIAGQPPRRFAASLTSNEREPQQWRDCWAAYGVDARAAVYEQVPVVTPRLLPGALDSSYTQMLCLVLPDIDKLVHAAQQGLADLYAALDVWLQAHELERGARWVETLIQALLDHGYWVVLTSDHGHVEAIGMGQPREGVTVESRAVRARLYDRAHFAEHVQAQYPDTWLWHDDGLLPDDRWVLMPQGRHAFTPAGTLVVSHGGLTLEELVVPLATITQ